MDMTPALFYTLVITGGLGLLFAALDLLLTLFCRYCPEDDQ
jgi:hypothetical protein